MKELFNKLSNISQFFNEGRFINWEGEKADFQKAQGDGELGKPKGMPGAVWKKMNTAEKQRLLLDQSIDKDKWEDPYEPVKKTRKKGKEVVKKARKNLTVAQVIEGWNKPTTRRKQLLYPAKYSRDRAYQSRKINFRGYQPKPGKHFVKLEKLYKEAEGAVIRLDYEGKKTYAEMKNGKFVIKGTTKAPQLLDGMNIVTAETGTSILALKEDAAKDLDDKREKATQMAANERGKERERATYADRLGKNIIKDLKFGYKLKKRDRALELTHPGVTKLLKDPEVVFKALATRAAKKFQTGNTELENSSKKFLGGKHELYKRLKGKSKNASQLAVDLKRAKDLSKCTSPKWQLYIRSNEFADFLLKNQRKTRVAIKQRAKVEHTVQKKVTANARYKTAKKNAENAPRLSKEMASAQTLKLAYELSSLFPKVGAYRLVTDSILIAAIKTMPKHKYYLALRNEVRKDSENKEKFLNNMKDIIMRRTPMLRKRFVKPTKLALKRSCNYLAKLILVSTNRPRTRANVRKVAAALVKLPQSHLYPTSVAIFRHYNKRSKADRGHFDDFVNGIRGQLKQDHELGGSATDKALYALLQTPKEVKTSINPSEMASNDPIQGLKIQDGDLLAKKTRKIKRK